MFFISKALFLSVLLTAAIPAQAIVGRIVRTAARPANRVLVRNIGSTTKSMSQTGAVLEKESSRIANADLRKAADDYWRARQGCEYELAKLEVSLEKFKKLIVALKKLEAPSKREEYKMYAKTALGTMGIYSGIAGIILAAGPVSDYYRYDRG